MNVVALAVQIREQISNAQIGASGKRWSWEGYLPGPMSNEDADAIMRIAGCWCEDPSARKVRFYTNQNHNEWMGF